MSRVTLQDVAKKAGVSTMTVSRVVNNKGKYSSETRQRVEKVIEELGYRPSTIARSLITNRSQTIGLMLPDITNPFFPDVARGAEDVAWENAYSLILCNTDEDQEREIQTLHFFEEKGVDGIFLCSPRLPDKLLLDLVKKHRTAVVYNRLSIAGNASSILVDEDSSMIQVVDHLAATGCKKLGFLTGPEHSEAGRRRVEAYKRVLGLKDIAFNANYLMPCATTIDDARQRGRELLNKHPEIDALICYNDIVAIGALQACQASGLDIPGDISIVGVDDIHMAAVTSPSLTTLAVSKYDIGATAIQLLLDQLERNQEPKTIMLRPKLIIRKSTKPLD